MTYIQTSGNKYHARSTEYSGRVYHSKLEAAYAAELDLRVMAHDIERWEPQRRLDLKVNGKHITTYIIDFIVYYNDGSREFVEVKGLEMELWRLKWKILEATFDEFKKHPDDRLLVIKQTSWMPPRFR